MSTCAWAHAGTEVQRFRHRHRVSEMPKFHCSRPLCRKGIAALGTRYWAGEKIGENMSQRLPKSTMIEIENQFKTIVMGIGAGSPLWVLTRNRCPSRRGT